MCSDISSLKMLVSSQERNTLQSLEMFVKWSDVFLAGPVHGWSHR